ncbi:death-associated kinase 1-like protein, putative [Babesia caballi]|uniref:Death-associated kinase 1-like protein, putative n=1 Tax=Babesia caballi TaxID=5871 RepID=A0AAV4M237_BABCB|nr:death-associated kinase 1-like protein, putative [Babesia caballi]
MATACPVNHYRVVEGKEANGYHPVNLHAKNPQPALSDQHRRRGRPSPRSGRGNHHVLLESLGHVLLNALVGERVAVTTNQTQGDDADGHDHNVTHENVTVKQSRADEEHRGAHVANGQDNDPVERVAKQPPAVNEDGHEAPNGLADLEDADEHDLATNVHGHGAGHHTRVEAEQVDVTDEVDEHNLPSVLETLQGRAEGALDGADPLDLDPVVVLADLLPGEVKGQVDAADDGHGSHETHDAVHHAADVLDGVASERGVLQNAGEEEGHDATQRETEAEGAQVVDGAEGHHREGGHAVAPEDDTERGGHAEGGNDDDLGDVGRALNDAGAHCEPRFDGVHPEEQRVDGAREELQDEHDLTAEVFDAERDGRHVREHKDRVEVEQHAEPLADGREHHVLLHLRAERRVVRLLAVIDALERARRHVDAAGVGIHFS